MYSCSIHCKICMTSFELKIIEYVTSTRKSQDVMPCYTGATVGAIAVSITSAILSIALLVFILVDKVKQKRKLRFVSNRSFTC